VTQQPHDGAQAPSDGPVETAEVPTGSPAGPGGDASPDTSPDSGFGDAAAEMANETEVEAGADPAVEPEPETESEVEAGRGRHVDDSAPPESEAEADELTLARIAVAERTADLQRLQAEFLNYKRRVERDRELIRENSTYAVLAPITEVLDTIDRAREHAPLEDGFKAVADQLERIVAGLGLSKFGEVGDPFDPTIHEALSHIGEDPEVKVTTCKVIAKAGYRIGDRVVRAAQVLVVDPASGPTE
jgi:molecular chaperone GrpE